MSNCCEKFNCPKCLALREVTKNEKPTLLITGSGGFATFTKGKGADMFKGEMIIDDPLKDKPIDECECKHPRLIKRFGAPTANWCANCNKDYNQEGKKRRDEMWRTLQARIAKKESE